MDEGVDVSSYSGGYKVVTTKAGEYLRYSVTITEDGTTLKARQCVLTLRCNVSSFRTFSFEHRYLSNYDERHDTPVLGFHTCTEIAIFRILLVKRYVEFCLLSLCTWKYRLNCILGERQVYFLVRQIVREVPRG